MKLRTKEIYFYKHELYFSNYSSFSEESNALGVQNVPKY